MAYQTGTADSERDLLTQLNTFLTTNSDLVAKGENWTQLYTHTIAATTSTVERLAYAWSAPGSTTSNQIYIGAQTNNNIPSDIYNVYFTGGSYFNASAFQIEQDVASGFINNCAYVGLCADIKTFNYWFFANSRRFIVVTKLNNVYSSAYCGFMMPSVTPLEYPYPLLISGSIDSTLRRYSTTTDYNTSIFDPRSQCCWLMYPDQGWRDFYGNSVNNGTTGATSRYLLPRGLIRYSYQYNWLVYKSLGPSSGEQYPLNYASLISNEDSGMNNFGVLDGVFVVNGISRAAEDIFDTDDGRHFITFNNAHRVDVFDFFVVEMV